MWNTVKYILIFIVLWILHCMITMRQEIIISKLDESISSTNEVITILDNLQLK